MNKEAEETFRRVHAAQEAELGADAEETLATASCIAQCLNAQGKSIESEEMYV